VARHRRRLTLTEDAAILDRMAASEEVVRDAVANGRQVYGITTGFGSMAEVSVPAEQAAASQANLLAFLSSGAGRPIDPAHVRAAMLLRANMLLQGASGVRVEIVQRLIQFLNEDATPVVGELGSIGASGDLVPLATIARAITGHAVPSRITVGKKELDGPAALAALGLEPLPLKPKEGLAIVNGTSFSAGIAANCVQPARNYLALSLASHAMMIRALLGHEEPFSHFVHDCKPHPGQTWTAQVMRELLDGGSGSETSQRRHLQDSYSLRCLPQYFGPIVDGIFRIARVVETEMNAVTDNPLIELREGEGRFYQSGNFLGQYIGVAMDDLRRLLGLMAKHLDVQIAQLVAPEFNHGLPASLHGNGDLSFNMGLKGLQITGNSIAPMLTYLGNPLIEHFPTHAEQFNQNVNSLSWGAATLANQSVDLYGHYTAIALIFAVQGVDLRARSASGIADGRQLLGPQIVPLYEAIYRTFGRQPGDDRPLVYNDADQSLETHLRALERSIREDGGIVEAVAPIVASFNELENDS